MNETGIYICGPIPNCSRAIDDPKSCDLQEKYTQIGILRKTDFTTQADTYPPKALQVKQTYVHPI